MKYIIRNKFNGKILTQPMSSYFKAEKILKNLNRSSENFEIVTSKQINEENPPAASSAANSSVINVDLSASQSSSTPSATADRFNKGGLFSNQSKSQKSGVKISGQE